MKVSRVVFGDGMCWLAEALVYRRTADSDLDLHLSVSAQVQIFGRQLDIYDWRGDP